MEDAPREGGSCSEYARDSVSQQYQFLDPKFLELMNDIGRYGFEKYAEDSFQARRLKGDYSRPEMERVAPRAIAVHAADHFTMYLAGVKHDKFDTLEHQLAASAFNAMMEFFFAGLGR
jgi:hypothetical protein